MRTRRPIRVIPANKLLGLANLAGSGSRGNNIGNIGRSESATGNTAGIPRCIRTCGATAIASVGDGAVIIISGIANLVRTAWPLRISIFIDITAALTSNFGGR